MLLSDGTDAQPAVIPDRPPLRSAALHLAIVVVIAFGGFGGWAAVATLKSAAVAPAIIAVESHRKTLQHLDGGIVRRLHVKEGDVVVANQLLIELDDVQARSKLTTSYQQYWSAAGRQARWYAEYTNASAVEFPATLTDRRSVPAVADVIDQQTGLFRSRLTAYRGKRAILERQIAQAQQSIAAMTAQLRSSIEQIRLVREEIKDIDQLYQKGLSPRPRLLALQRTEAELRGRQGELEGNILRTQQEIAQRDLDLVDLDNQRRADAARELETVQRELGDLVEQISANADMLQRAEIRAPVGGTVVGMQTVAIGGVIKATDPILDIVPVDDELIAEAKVSPTDIDNVHVGLPAELHLLAYKQRDVPSVGGVVFHVSADRLNDPRSGDPYYLARIRINRNELARLSPVELTAGMPADALIITGDRTALQYFLTPILAGLRRAFREE